MRGPPDDEREVRERTRQVGLVLLHLFLPERALEIVGRSEYVGFRSLDGRRPERRAHFVEHDIQMTERPDAVAGIAVGGRIAVVASADEGVHRPVSRTHVSSVPNRVAVFDAHDLCDRRAHVGERADRACVIVGSCLCPRRRRQGQDACEPQDDRAHRAFSYGRVKAVMVALVGCEYVPSRVGAPAAKRGSAKLMPAGPDATTTYCFPPKLYDPGGA